MIRNERPFCGYVQLHFDNKFGYICSAGGRGVKSLILVDTGLFHFKWTACT